MNITRYFSDVKRFVEEGNSRTQALLWLIEITLLLNMFAN